MASVEGERRFEVDGPPGLRRVRVLQGHSAATGFSAAAAFTPLGADGRDEWVLHATTLARVPTIADDGLVPGGPVDDGRPRRGQLHFLGAGTVTFDDDDRATLPSAVRHHRPDVLVLVHVPTALADGVQLFQVPNGTVLADDAVPAYLLGPFVWLSRAGDAGVIVDPRPAAAVDAAHGPAWPLHDLIHTWAANADDPLSFQASALEAEAHAAAAAVRVCRETQAALAAPAASSDGPRAPVAAASSLTPARPSRGVSVPRASWPPTPPRHGPSAAPARADAVPAGPTTGRGSADRGGLRRGGAPPHGPSCQRRGAPRAGPY